MGPPQGVGEMLFRQRELKRISNRRFSKLVYNPTSNLVIGQEYSLYRRRWEVYKIESPCGHAKENRVGYGQFVDWWDLRRILCVSANSGKTDRALCLLSLEGGSAEELGLVLPGAGGSCRVSGQSIISTESASVYQKVLGQSVSAVFRAHRVSDFSPTAEVYEEGWTGAAIVDVAFDKCVTVVSQEGNPSGESRLRISIRTSRTMEVQKEWVLSGMRTVLPGPRWGVLLLKAGAELQTLDLETGEFRHVVTLTPSACGRCGVVQARYIDDRHVATSEWKEPPTKGPDDMGLVRIWDVETGQMTRSVDVELPVGTVVSCGGCLLLSASGDHQGGVYRWRVR